MPHADDVPAPPQVAGAVQLPQVSVWPQPSPVSPQATFSAWHVVGAQVPPVPHTPRVPPPPQVWGEVQLPQLIVPPQPSAAIPHSTPVGHVVWGMH
jgi:hypothetical protein